MARGLIFLILLHAVPVFICGCAAAESGPAEPATFEEPDLRPVHVEPEKTVPPPVPPAKVEPVHVEPDDTEPGQAEPAKPETAGPNDVEPETIEPDATVAPQARPDEPVPGPNDVLVGRAEPREPELDEAASSKAVPGEVEPATREPNDVEPEKAEPNDAKPGPATSFHDQCAEILKSYVDDTGKVDFKALRRKRLDLRALLQKFDSLDPNEYQPWPKEDKIAFWINVYNLQKLRVVTDNYPVRPSSRILSIYWGPRSLRHIEREITRHKFLVMDEEFTFARIDKRFFRSEFDDPRVFFALWSACLSSPPLRNEPYYGYKLGEQLDDQTTRFLSSPLAFKIDRAGQKVYLSALFQLSSYGNEFIERFAIDKKFKDHSPATRAVLNFISHYVSPREVSFLEVGNYTVEYMRYDWTINDGS